MNKVFIGDCRDTMKDLIAQGVKVQMCVTSPPYWGLRSYLASDDPDKQYEMGSEKTPEEYVAKMVEVFRLVRELLRDEGTLWLNLGDSYTHDQPGRNRNGTGGQIVRPYGEESLGRVQKGNNKIHSGLKSKDLIGIPWRVAFALRADGWYLRSDIIWHKPNPMPESVTDRPTKAHEYVFLLSKSQRYYYDQDAVREEGAQNKWGKYSNPKYGNAPNLGGKMQSAKDLTREEYIEKYQKVNLRSVWTIATQPYKEAHFATYPPALIIPCIKTGTSEKGCCPECGAGWKRIIKQEKSTPRAVNSPHATPEDQHRFLGHARYDEPTKTETLGWQPTCKCGHDNTVPCVVLDPFFGSGTTGEVCEKLGRKWIGCELNEKYEPLWKKRTAQAGLGI